MCKIGFMINLKKSFIQIILFLVFFTISSHAEIVKKVEITGNERISNETIIIFGDVTLGKDYKKSDINLLIKKLYETTFFSTISVDLINNKLSIIVAENPIINSIVLEGEKAKANASPTKPFPIIPTDLVIFIIIKVRI